MTLYRKHDIVWGCEGSEDKWLLYGHSVLHYIILGSAPTAYLYVLCGSENKQRLFPYTTLTGWFSEPRRGVFTRGTGWIFNCFEFNQVCHGLMDILRSYRS